MLWVCGDSKQRNTDGVQTITAEMPHCSSRSKYPIEVLIFSKLLTIFNNGSLLFFLPSDRCLGARPYI